MSKAQQKAILSSSALSAVQKELLVQNAGLTASQTAPQLQHPVLVPR